MKNKFLCVGTGFALFSMFFGSGNLVFPLALGKENLDQFPLALLGLFITAVIVPLVGVLGMILFQGSAQKFFGVLGEKQAFWLSFIILALMGPFGVLARCITVAHGSFQLLFPSVSLAVFSLLFSLATFFVALNKGRIVPILGSFLTPFLLLSLALIAFFGFCYGETPSVSSLNAWQAFQGGFFKGYQMMDLLAAFFFSSFIIQHIKEKTPQESQLKTFIYSSLVGGGLLAITYAALVYLGASFAPQLEGQAPEKSLGIVASMTMGSYSLIAVSVASVLACLTTAVVLTSLFADFFRKEMVKEKVSNNFSLMLTLGIAFLVSLLEFAGIAKILGPILEVIYPALIVLTGLNIISSLWGLKVRRWPVFATIIARLLSS
jgi:LIVCS family branched-chain amino acid:cation transporter